MLLECSQRPPVPLRPGHVDLIRAGVAHPGLGSQGRPTAQVQPQPKDPRLLEPWGVGSVENLSCRATWRDGGGPSSGSILLGDLSHDFQVTFGCGKGGRGCSLVGQTRHVVALWAPARPRGCGAPEGTPVCKARTTQLSIVPNQNWDGAGCWVTGPQSQLHY